MSAALAAEGVAHRVQSAGNLFCVFFGPSTANPVTNFAQAQATETFRYAPFFHAMLDAGVYLPPSAYESWFVSAAHDDAAHRPDRRRAAGRGQGGRDGRRDRAAP